MSSDSCEAFLDLRVPLGHLSMPAARHELAAASLGAGLVAQAFEILTCHGHGEPSWKFFLDFCKWDKNSRTDSLEVDRTFSMDLARRCAPSIVQTVEDLARAGDLTASQRIDYLALMELLKHGVGGAFSESLCQGVDSSQLARLLSWPILDENGFCSMELSEMLGFLSAARICAVELARLLSGCRAFAEADQIEWRNDLTMALAAKLPKAGWEVFWAGLSDEAKGWISAMEWGVFMKGAGGKRIASPWRDSDEIHTALSMALLHGNQSAGEFLSERTPVDPRAAYRMAVKASCSFDSISAPDEEQLAEREQKHSRWLSWVEAWEIARKMAEAKVLEVDPLRL